MFMKLLFLFTSISIAVKLLKMINLHVILYGLALFIVQVLMEPPEGIFNKFKQNDYKLKFERLEVVSFNKSILKRFEMVTYKYNRTLAAVNGTIYLNINVGSKPEVVVQLYKFMSNEYRYFPIRFQVNICYALSKNLVGLKRVFQCGNFSGCPFPQHTTIRVCNWYPDESNLPPFIPDGRYMGIFQLMYEATEAAVFRAYAEVYRPIPYI